VTDVVHAEVVVLSVLPASLRRAVGPGLVAPLPLAFGLSGFALGFSGGPLRTDPDGVEIFGGELHRPSMMLRELWHKPMDAAEFARGRCATHYRAFKRTNNSAKLRSD